MKLIIGSKFITSSDENGIPAKTTIFLNILSMYSVFLVQIF